MQELEQQFKADGGTFEEYRIGELFDIHPTNAYKLTNYQIFHLGGINPVVTNSSVNNGIAGYSNLTPTEKGNMITYSDTTTSDGIFYQPDNFVGYPHVQGLYPKVSLDKWNEKTLLYFVSLFRKSAGGRFDYANKFNRTIASSMLVSIPTLANGEISFAYMENVIRELQDERLSKLNDYLKESGLDNTELSQEETNAVLKLRKGNVECKEFKIGELFTCRTGDVDVQRKHLNGKGHLYINSGVTNLGIIGRTDYPATVFPSNTITIDMFGNAYFRDFDYKMATHAHVFSLTFLPHPLNEVLGLFICTQLKYFTKLFSFSNMCNWTKMKEMIICLPITSDGEINWNFMQNLISAESRLAIRAVVEWKDQQYLKPQS